MTSFLKAVAVVAFGLAHVHPALSQQSSCAKWNGVWEYTMPGQTGMFIVANEYSVGIYTAVRRAPLGEQPTVQERATAFDSLFAESWRIRCEGQRMYFDVLQSSHPNRIGTKLISDVKLSGDEASWRLLTPAGEQTGAGSARRIQR